VKNTETILRELYHDFSFVHETEEKNFGSGEPANQLTRFVLLVNNVDMDSPQAPAIAKLPDRLCTWCQVPMRKRLVGGNQFIHYTCPKCIFQHTTRLGPKPQTPAH